MNKSLLDLLILLVGASMGLIQALGKTGNKRVTKASYGLFNFLQFAVLVYGIYALLPNALYRYLIIMAYVLGFIIISYYSGTNYTIRAENKELLVDLIYDALKEMEYVKPEKRIKEKNIIFEIPYTSRKLVFTAKESEFSKKVNYSIRFKRWLNFSSRRDILSFIEEGLRGEEELKSNIFKTIGEILLGIALFCFALYVASKGVMDTEDMRNFLRSERPQELHMIQSGNRITHEAEILELHNVIVNGYMTRPYSDLTVIRNTPYDAVLSYNEGRMQVFINIERSTAYVYIDYLFIAEKSILHRLSWEIQRIFNNEEGTYRYMIFQREDIMPVMNKLVP